MKKLISIILAIVLCASCVSVSAFAASDVTPVIVISGMNSYPLYNEDGKSVFPMGTDVLLKDIPPILGTASASLVTSNWKYLGNHGLSYIADLLGGIACDETGASVDNLHTDLFPGTLENYKDHFSTYTVNQEGTARAVADKIGWNNTYFMNYDWRMSPLDLADELNEYINQVKEEKGVDKVSLVPMSFGGTIVNSYIMKYGTESIKTIVYASTAFNGVEMVGRLFSGDPTITLKDVLVYMAAFTQDIDFLTDILSLAAAYESSHKTVVGNYIDKMVVSLVKDLGDEVYAQVFGTSLAHMKGIWCLMPNEYYQSSREYMEPLVSFSSDFFDDIDEYMAFQKDLSSTLNSLIDDGINVYITGTYGFSGIPVSEGSKQRTDTLIETYLMTGNSTVAPYGKTLDDVEYTPVGDGHNHISGDNIIDASTAMLPEQTWFVKGIGHLKYEYGTRAEDLLVYLATSDELQNVFSNPDFPQFIQMNNKTKAASSLTDGVEINEKGNTKWYDIISTVFSKFISIVIKLFGLNKVS